jgi:low affinity Fe/Cu permease
MKETFRKLANASAEAMGSPWAFFLASVITIAWVVTGPIFHFSDTWQLVINSITNVATFLVVFLIQNTQNREAKAIHLKLDELLRGVEGARTSLVDLEGLSDAELEHPQREFQHLQEWARRRATRAQEEAGAQRMADCCSRRSGASRQDQGCAVRVEGGTWNEQLPGMRASAQLCH